MTYLFAVMLPGMVVGLGIAVVVSALAPRTPQLVDVLDRMNEAPAMVSASSSESSLNERVGGRLLRRFGGSSWLQIPESDLRLIRMPANRFVTRKALMALMGLVLPFAIGMVFQALGLIAFYIPGVFGIPLAALGWYVPNLIVRDQAAEARGEFARSVAVYIELVASERKRGAPPTEALEQAATVGRSWVFVRLRQELNEARLAGVAAWDGLESLAREINTPDLADLAKRMRLTGEEGASAYDALRAQGRSLRDKLLNQQHSEANRQTTLLQVPLVGVGFTFMVILATPFLLNTFVK